MAEPVTEPTRPRVGRAGIGRKSALDMVRSLALILGVVAVLYLLVPRSNVVNTRTADLPAAAAAARAAGDVAVVVPATPEGWTVTSAHRRPAGDTMNPSWHIGYLADSGGYVGVETTPEATRAWLAEYTVEGVDTQTTQDVAGIGWQVWQSATQQRTSLVRGGEGGPTTLVTGTATLDELVEMATAVQAVGGASTG